MARTVSGHPVLRNYDPRLARRYVPGRPIWLRTHRDALPLFLRLAVLLDQVPGGQLKMSDTWSYALRKPRAGDGWSDHAGWACDFLAARQGANTGTGPSKMPATMAAAWSAILEKFKTPDGRHVFLWGASNKQPGVVYTGPTYSRLNDPMHAAVAPGITVTDLKRTAKAMGIKSDGTVSA